MPDYAPQVLAVIGSTPADLSDFYASGDIPAYPDSRINCLPFEGAKASTEAMQGIAVVDQLGLWVLDDANDSNPFAYISKGPCRGMIIHFSHDPEPTIAFSSLAKFVAAMHDAGRRELDIDEIEKEPIKAPLDQVIRDLAAASTEDATFFLGIYLPISAKLQNETMTSLASHDDFFAREALANFIANNPSLDSQVIADRLSTDGHPQVARAGKAAIAAIRRKTQTG